MASRAPMVLLGFGKNPAKSVDAGGQLTVHSVFRSSEIDMWQCEIRHDGLHKYRVVKGATQAIMQLRGEMQMQSWNEQWERTQGSRAKKQAQLKGAQAKETNKQTAVEHSREAQEDLNALESLLTSVLEVDHTINWEQLKDRS